MASGDEAHGVSEAMSLVGRGRGGTKASGRLRVKAKGQKASFWAHLIASSRVQLGMCTRPPIPQTHGQCSTAPHVPRTVQLGRPSFDDQGNSPCDLLPYAY